MNTMTTSNSFASRLEDALKLWGQFKPSMNRSFLILALFEAKRCLLPRFPSMRPFERNIALIATTMDLIYTLDFLSAEQKAGIVSLTVKNDTKPCIAKITFANRGKQIQEAILPGIEELLSEEKTHDEICDEFLQKKYQEKTGETGARPPLWEFRNIPSFLVYRVYYRKLEIDQDIFVPVAPREVNVPVDRPGTVWQYAIRNWSPMDESYDKASYTDLTAKHNGNSIARDSGANKADGKECPKMNGNKTVEGKGALKVNHKKRLELLMEIKIRLELLKELEGIFPEKRMARETKILFSALPPALAASEVKNRQAAIMEAQLRMDLLKKMKTVIPPKKIANEMRKLFMGLPPLPTCGNGGGEAKVEASKVRKHTNNNNGEKIEEDGWESVNEMKDVNVAVDGMEIA